MSAEITWSKNAADTAQLRRLLECCDNDFSPPLSQRVNLYVYVERLYAFSERFEAWIENQLIGFVAIYCNAPDKREAFISNVSVAPNYRKLRVAERLVRNAIECAMSSSFQAIVLEVDSSATAAKKLYSKVGFRPVSTDGHKQLWAHRFAEGIDGE